MPDLTPYGWTDDQMAICVAVVRGRTEDDVVDGYGGDPAEAEPASFDSARDRGQDGDSILFVGGSGESVLAAEDNGWQGSRPEVLREVTADPYPAFWRQRAGLAVRAALAADPAVAAWAAATAGGVDLPAGAPVREALLAALAGR